jgi:DNA-binding transcriptional ArsR family regulator
VRVASSEAIELLAGIWAFLDIDHRPTYEVGGAWFRAVSEALGRDAVRFSTFLGGSPLAWDHVIGLAAEAPGTTAALLERLEKMEPERLRATLLGVHDGILARSVQPHLLAAAAEGDPDARRRVRRLTARHGASWQTALRQLFEGDATALRDELIRLIRAWGDAVADDAGPRLAAEASRAGRELSAGDPAAVAEALLGDVPLRIGPETRDVLLVPSVVSRPFTLYVEHRERMTFIYPLAEAGDEPMPGRGRLVSMARALGDPMRVDLLGELRGGELTLRELMERTGWARSTLRHHLDQLVDAGLVRHTPGHVGRYALREGGSADLAELLRRFLASG